MLSIVQVILLFIANSYSCRLPALEILSWTWSTCLARYISNIFQLFGQIYIEHIPAGWPDIYRTYFSCLVRYISNIFQLSGQIFIEHIPAVWTDIYRTYFSCLAIYKSKIFQLSAARKYRTDSSCLARYISNIFQLSGQIYIEHIPAVWTDIYRTYSSCLEDRYISNVCINIYGLRALLCM